MTLGCTEIKVLIQAEIDGRLMNRQKTEFDQHITQCPACEQELQEMRNLVALVEGMERVQPAEDFAARVMSRLPARREPRKVLAPLLIGVRRWTIPAFSCVLFLGIFTWNALYIGYSIGYSQVSDVYFDSLRAYYDLLSTFMDMYRAFGTVVRPFETIGIIALQLVTACLILLFLRAMLSVEGRIKIRVNG